LVFIFQKTAFFMVTAVKTSNPLYVVDAPLLRSFRTPKFNFTFKALHSLSSSLLVGGIFIKYVVAVEGERGVLKWYYTEEVFVCRSC
jgi:hypothetical protein